MKGFKFPCNKVRNGHIVLNKAKWTIEYNYNNNKTYNQELKNPVEFVIICI